MSASRGAIRAGAAHSARRRARVRGAAARAAADPPFNAVNVIHLIHVIRAHAGLLEQLARGRLA
ncbi:hypothetical protein ACUTF1_27060, partial [Burkholderia pseudomallei]